MPGLVGSLAQLLDYALSNKDVGERNVLTRVGRPVPFKLPSLLPEGKGRHPLMLVDPKLVVRIWKWMLSDPKLVVGVNIVFFRPVICMPDP